MGEYIMNFSGKHEFLSNFYYFPILFEGVMYKTSEHAYQAQKTIIDDEKKAIMSANTPGKAKALGRICSIRKDWDSVKVPVMRDVLWAKFSNPEMSKLLLGTGNIILIEANEHGDVFWGVYKSKGENMLGKLLMEIRDELRSPDDVIYPN